MATIPRAASILMIALALTAGARTVSAQSFDVDYEKVLLPVVSLDKAYPGALGSLWTTRLTVTNPNAQDINNLFSSWHFDGQATTPSSQALPGNSTILVASVAGPPNGSFWLIERRYVDSLQISLRVQDVSRQSQTWGTTLPVVRERQFVNATRILNDVPVASTSRTMLRVYSFDSTQHSRVRISLYQPLPSLGVAKPSDVLIGARDFELSTYTPPAQYAAFNVVPGYLEISQLEAIAPLSGYDRVRIDITPLDTSRVWAFASVTNNETQHVTVLSPSF